MWKFGRPDCLRETVIGRCTLLLHARSSPVGSCLRPAAGRHSWESREVESCRSHIRRITCSLRQKTCRGTAAVSLVTQPGKLAQEGVSGRRVQGPCYSPAGASQPAASSHGVMCRRPRLEASGLSRGAAQSPRLSPSRGEKKERRSSWLNDPIKMQEIRVRPRGASAFCNARKPRMDFHQRWHRPVILMTLIPSILFSEHIWCARDSFCYSIYISEAGRPPVPTASVSCLAATCKLPLFQSLELLVLLHMHEPQNQCQERDHEAYDSICRASWYVSWGGCSWVHVRAVNGGRVADHICDGDRDGALDKGPWERVGYPGNNDLVCSGVMICQISLHRLLIDMAAYAG